MPAHETQHTHDSEEPSRQSTTQPQQKRPSRRVTGARAAAQRAKLDAQADERQQAATNMGSTKQRGGKQVSRPQGNRRANPTVARAIEDYLLDHEGGNHSPKTLEWHRTALKLMRTYFEAERGVTLVGEVEASDINAWFAHMRKCPGGLGKPRSERTIQTYARSARAFFHWLVRRETIDRNPFDHVVFPKVGQPLIHTIDAEEFERLLLACDAVARITALCPCTLHIFAAGERAKNLLTVEALAQEALVAGVTRRSCIIGLGGGLAGNVAGLLAALLFRGIRLVHIPTTLLAMSDSVLSLKQAVNTRLGKNHLGYLRSLPVIEIRAALCELIKNVLAICPQHYTRVASLLNPAAVYTEEQYVQFIEWCVTAKCSVMGNDPQEKRDALVLEYGHTAGHALELLAQEVLPAGTLPHGLAIGLGMLVAARISCMMGWLSADDEQAHMELLRRNGVPTAIPEEIPTVALISAINHDNKRGYLPETMGTSLMVLLERLGRPHRSQGTVLTQVPIETLYAGIEALRH